MQIHALLCSLTSNKCDVVVCILESAVLLTWNLLDWYCLKYRSDPNSKTFPRPHLVFCSYISRKMQWYTIYAEISNVIQLKFTMPFVMVTRYFSLSCEFKILLYFIAVLCEWSRNFPSSCKVSRTLLWWSWPEPWLSTDNSKKRYTYAGTGCTLLIQWTDQKWKVNFKLIVGCLATIILGTFQRSLECCESLTQTTYKNKINFSMFV